MEDNGVDSGEEDSLVSSIPPVPENTPPAPPRRAEFDFVRPFAFVFDDRDWLTKILLGGLFYLASFLIVGIPFVAGYAARTAKNVIDGKELPLPDWSDLGGIFGEGIKIAVVGIIYLIPQFVITIAWVFGQALTERMFYSHGPQTALGCVFVLFIPFFFVLYLLMPAAIIRVIGTGRFEAGFELPSILRMITHNGLNYILAILVYLVVGFVAQFGVILLCVGVFFTAFWAMLVKAHAFGQFYRLSETK